MADLSLSLDLGAIQKSAEDLVRLDQDLNQAAAKLAGQAHLHIIEEVQTRLHTRRQKYLEALVRPAELEPGVWVITLDAKAVWIEEGMPQHSMVDDLLRTSKHGTSKKPAETAEDGSTYRVIPFEQKKGPTRQTTAEQTLTATLKKELRQRGIQWAKVERDSSGKPKTGLLHSFDTKDTPGVSTPARPAFAQPVPNQSGDPRKPMNDKGFGRGSIGQPMQGPSAPGAKDSGVPFLKGVRIYQTPVFETGADGKQRPKLDKNGIQSVNRSIVTFRVVSSKHKGQKWEFPGIEGTHFFEHAYEWAKTEWDQKILPELLRKHGLDGGTGAT